MPPSPTPDSGDEIAEAKATFDRLLVDQSAAEQEMVEAKNKWAFVSGQLLEAHFILQALIRAAHR